MMVVQIMIPLCEYSPNRQESEAWDRYENTSIQVLKWDRTRQNRGTRRTTNTRGRTTPINISKNTKRYGGTSPIRRHIWIWY